MKMVVHVCKVKTWIDKPPRAFKWGIHLGSKSSVFGAAPQIDQRQVIISGLKLPLTIDVPTINHGEST